MVELNDRYRGSIVGLAVGDALGHPTEFISSVAGIKQRFGEKGITDFAGGGMHPPGTFTDDTQMTICVARALCLDGTKDLDTLMTTLGQEFVAWSRHPSNNRAPGGTCMTGCRNFKSGAAWRDAGVKGSKGCGAAMRAAPIGLYAFDDDDKILELAAAQSVLTHSHPTGIASSVAAAAPVAWLCRGNGPDGIIAFTRALVERVDAELLISLGAEEDAAHSIGNKEQLALLDRLEACLDEETDDVCSLLGGAWIGEEAVATALWCFIKAKGDFTESIQRGATSSGDSDSIACIAGSFSGALHGHSGLISPLRDRVERHDDLVLLADQLYQARQQGDRDSLPKRLDFFGIDGGGRQAPANTQVNVSVNDETMDDDGDETGSDSGDDDPHPAGADFLDNDNGNDNDDDDDNGNDNLDALITGNDIAGLERAVRKHNDLYWVHQQPIISDVRFDQLVRRLTSLKPESAVLGHLGSAPSAEKAEKAVRHKRPMRSLDKCYEDDVLARWTEDFSGDVVAMPKVDGLACTILYDDDGDLVLAATRGDGEVGENVTANVRAIRDIPKRVGRGPLEVRGEIYVSLARFEAIVAESALDAPKNPRNLAAGALRQKDPEKTRAVGLSFLAYDLIIEAAATSHGSDGNDGRGAAPAPTTHKEKLAALAGLGFPPIPQAVAPRHLAKMAVEAIASRRDQLGYETDGVVLIVDDLGEHERLGATSHHPRYAIAWKFQGEEGESVLRGVHWQVARTGTISPVAVVDPVALSGVTVTRATLHHKGFMEALGLSIGAKVAMVRRGGVIPHVERVLTPGDTPIVLPTTCPSCGSDVVVEGDFLLCGQPDQCVAARIGRLLHWGKNVDIIGLGESVCEQLVETGLATTPAHLYELTSTKLATLGRLGPTLAEKLLAEIDKSRRLPMDVFVRALGIEGLGKTVARQLSERFVTLKRLREATRFELASLKGFGDVSAAAIVAGLRDNGPLIDALLTTITLEDTAEATTSTTTGPLTGKSFVFTGALTIDRKSAEARVRAGGAQTPSGVTKALTHLVVGGDRASPSSKQKAAEKLISEGADIAILDEAAFSALMATIETSSSLITAAPPQSSTAPLEANAAANDNGDDHGDDQGDDKSEDGVDDHRSVEVANNEDPPWSTAEAAPSPASAPTTSAAEEPSPSTTSAKAPAAKPSHERQLKLF